MSVTWYTWLEQGRNINPSRQVLDAVAAALHLTATEHDYVLGLAGFTFERPAQSGGAGIPDHVQRFLDALDNCPAFALTADWRIAGWNTAYAELYPNVETVHPSERNLLAMVFTDPFIRGLLPDWPTTSRRFLAEFRASAGSRLDDPAYVDLVRTLTETSPEFRAGWAQHDIGGFSSRLRTFHHPAGEDRVYEHHQMRPSDNTDVELVVYVPTQG